MAEVVVAQRMWQRRGSAAEWSAANPILAAGEIGIELGATAEDTKFKIGNGVAPWNTLPYFSGSGGEPVEFQATATHIQWREVGAVAWIDLVPLSEITGPAGVNGVDGATGATGPAGPPGPASSAYFGAVFDGGGDVISVGAQCDVRVPYGCTITKVSLLADQVGSIVIDVWADSYANYPPTAGDSITASAKPTISASNKSEDAALAGWNTIIASGTVLRFNVNSCSAIERATILLEGVRG